MGTVNHYYKRAIEPFLIKSFKNSKIVSVLGARQSGKSTMINHVFLNLEEVNLKNAFMINSAKNNPESFLKGLSIPSFIDEIQNAPILFGYLQEVVDKRNAYGQYIISGSNQLDISDMIKQSLAGRTAIIELNGLSLREIYEIDFNERFIPTDEYLAKRKKKIKDYGDIWNIIHRGSYPELYDNVNKDWELFYSSYLQTYLEKDVLKLINLKDDNKFYNFLVSVASRTGEILNYESIASEVGVSAVSIKEWTNVLIKTNIIYLLYPYASSHLTRVIKSPKIYFRDTGLAAFLSGWLTKDQLKRGAKAGNFFETFVVNEIIKSFANEGKEYRNRLFYYRGKDKFKTIGEDKKIKESEKEIDLIIEENGVLYPIEIKKKDIPVASDANAFQVLDNDIDKKRGMGVIISSSKERIMLRDNLIVLPIEYI